MKEWFDTHTRSQRARQLAEALVRLMTYCGDFPKLSARASLEQFQFGMSGGVLYLDGGWGTLIQGLTTKAKALGVEIKTGVPMKQAEPGMVLAVSPEAVQGLTGNKLPSMNPVRAASLDIGFSSVPAASAHFALALDHPLYFSMHSPSVLHVAKYLVPGDAATREELEGFADLLAPGWRGVASVVRFLPNLTVTHALPEPAGRPEPDAIPGMAIAGDWVGPDNMLADAAIASALRTADLVWRKHAMAA